MTILHLSKYVNSIDTLRFGQAILCSNYYINNFIFTIEYLLQY